MANLVKVLFILVGVLALAGCASMPDQPAKPVKPENVILDWKDFYPADFVSGCNQVHTGNGKIKTITKTCYQTRYGNTDHYSLIVDLSTFDLADQSFFNNRLANKTHLQKTLIDQFIGLDCVSSINRIRDNAYSCQITNGQNMLLVTNFLLGNGKLVEARLLLSPEQLNNLDTEYQTAIRIISDTNLRQFLVD